MLQIPKCPPPRTLRSFDHIQSSVSDKSLCPDEQVVGKCGGDTQDQKGRLSDGRRKFDAQKDDQEGIVCCHISVSADPLLKEVPARASKCEVSNGSLSEVGDDGRWSVLLDQQKRDIESVLVKWLNAEVRDRLDSIEKRLSRLHMHEPVTSRRRNSCIQQVLKLPGTDVSMSSSFESAEPSFATSEFGQANYWDPSPSDRTAMSMKRNEHIAATIRNHENIRGRFAARAWRFFEDRFSSLTAYLWSFVIPSVVLMSLIVSLWQTVDGYPLSRTVGQIMQASFEIVFVVELLLRFLVCPDRWTFCKNPFNVVDLLTCLPLGFRLGIAIGSPNMENVLATDILLPVLRLLKLIRRFEKFLLLLNAFMISLEALPVLLYTMLIIAVTFSGLMYAVEPRENIANMPEAMWFVIVTMTTLGYGDILPASLLGQFICSLLMVVSILYTAMPMGIVGSAFGKAWELRDRLLLMHRFREAFLQAGFSEKAFRDIVGVFAGDCDNELGLDEFQAMLQTMNINITADRVQMLLNDLDEDGSGRVSVDELLGGLFPQDYATYFNNMKLTTARSETSHAFEMSRSPIGIQRLTSPQL